MDRLLAVMTTHDAASWAAASRARPAQLAAKDWGFPYRAPMLWWEAEAAAVHVLHEPADPLLTDALWGAAVSCMLTGRIATATSDTLRELCLAADLAFVLPPAGWDPRRRDCGARWRILR
jgi:hypothetical protein